MLQIAPDLRPSLHGDPLHMPLHRSSHLQALVALDVFQHQPLTTSLHATVGRQSSIAHFLLPTASAEHPCHGRLCTPWPYRVSLLGPLDLRGCLVVAVQGHLPRGRVCERCRNLCVPSLDHSLDLGHLNQFIYPRDLQGLR